MKTLVLLLITILICAEISLAQDINSDTTGYVMQNLQFDVSSPDDAIKLLGKPKSDKLDELNAGNIHSWLKVGKNEKVFRKLTFKNKGEAKEILLYFYQDKLVRNIFIYQKKRVSASNLIDKFKIDFFMFDGIPKDSKISDYEGQKDTTIPKVYNVAYPLGSVQPKLIFTALVMNDSFKAAFRKLRLKTTKEAYPGYVAGLSIISRSLEKTN